MKRTVLTALMLVGIVGSASAQRDDLYFVPKKKAKVESTSQAEATVEEVATESYQEAVESSHGLSVDEDAYNRRWSYLTDKGDAVSEFAKREEGFLLITEEGDTLLTDSDTLQLTRVPNDEGWVNGFEGSDSDYEYAMRIVRFRNPRYAIPVSSPLYWDVVYGGALWPSWEWNVYDDGLYAYVFPTSSNWYYWDYRMGYPYGWNMWNTHWGWHYGTHWGHHWGSHWGWDYYSYMWYDPWHYHYYGYYPGWHHGPHHGFYPGIGVGKPGWGGVTPGQHPRRNDRQATVASTRRGTQTDNAATRGSVSSTAPSRQGSTATRNGSTVTRNSSVRVITDRTNSAGRSTGAVRTSTGIRSGNDEVVRRGTTSSSFSRGTSTGSSSRSEYTRQSTSRSGSSSSYNRPSSTRSSSSSVSRSSSSSRSGSYSSGSSSSSRSSSSSSYSSGSSSRSSSYSSGSSYSSSSRSSSYSGGGSYSGGSSRSSGGSYGGGSRSGGSSGSRR